MNRSVFSLSRLPELEREIAGFERRFAVLQVAEHDPVLRALRGIPAGPGTGALAPALRIVLQRQRQAQGEIAVEQIGMALGKSPAQVNRLRQEVIELNQLDEIFAGAS